MRKISVIGELINSEGVEILDENNIPVIICKPSFFKFNYNMFRPPSLLIDNFEKRRYKDIEIKVIDLNYLNRLGYRLISIKSNSRIRNYPKQLQSYMLESPLKPIPNSIILNKIPKDHFIEFDITNNRVRIKGRNGFPYYRPENATPWVSVIKK